MRKKSSSILFEAILLFYFFTSIFLLIDSGPVNINLDDDDSYDYYGSDNVKDCN